MTQAQNQPQQNTSANIIHDDLTGNIDNAFETLQRIWTKATNIRLLDQSLDPKPEVKKPEASDFVGAVYHQIDRLRDLNISLRNLEDHMSKII